jgi:hypothetical protein
MRSWGTPSDPEDDYEGPPHQQRWNSVGTHPWIDGALDAIASDNPELPGIYLCARRSGPKLGECVGAIARIGFGDDPEWARDILGDVHDVRGDALDLGSGEC